MRFAGLIEVVVTPLAYGDRLLNAIMPAWLVLIIWGGLVGALSTTIYRTVAPATRIAKVRADATKARRALQNLTEDTEFGAVLTLAWKSIHLSLNEIGLVIGPTTMACVPGLLIVSYLNSAPAYNPTDLAPHSWGVWFVAAALVTGLMLRRLPAAGARSAD